MFSPFRVDHLSSMPLLLLGCGVLLLIHMPPWVLKELNLLLFSFFWKGKRELVARSSVVQPFLFGGFSVIDVKSGLWLFSGSNVLRAPLLVGLSSCPSGSARLSICLPWKLSDPYGVAILIHNYAAKFQNALGM